MNFDKIDCHNGIQYGIVAGSEKQVYIKVGRGGTIFGYNNKYLEIAVDIVSKYGWSVLVASNPSGIKEADNMERDMAYIQNCFPNQMEEIRCFGVSNGGLMFLQQSWKYPFISKVLSINAPLFINWYRTQEGIEKASQTFTCLVWDQRSKL